MSGLPGRRSGLLGALGLHALRCKNFDIGAYLNAYSAPLDFRHFQEQA